MDDLIKSARLDEDGTLKTRIALMHEIFGIDEEHQCKTCCHLEKHGSNRQYWKCKAYGITASTATDWRLKWTACGLYNKPYTNDISIIELKKHMPKPIIETQCEGQITIEDLYSRKGGEFEI